MSDFLIDERDILFNLKECPGMSAIETMEFFEEADEDALDMIFDQAKNFCVKVLAPLSRSSDRESCHLKDGVVELPEGIAEAWEQYSELGLTGMTSSSEFGGSDLPHFFAAPVAEMQCGSFLSFSMLPMLTHGAARLIESFGSQDQKELYLERMYTGEWTGTMCLTEPGAGSDVGAGITKAVPNGDTYKITGTKIFITWGDHELTDNIIHLVLARIEGSPAGSKGLSLFIVPKKGVNADGTITGGNNVSCGNIEHKMGIKASPTCVINFDESTGYLLGTPNQGMRMMFQMMNSARIEVGTQGMAVGASAYLSALSYASERVQGTVKDENGVRNAKIIEHPDVRRMLLKMRALIQASRAMLYNIMLFEDLLHHGSEEEQQKYGALVEVLTPIAKSYGSDQGFRVTELAIQTYGGYGFCQEYPVEQYMRDCKITSIYEGTNGIQALDLVFRKILMNKGASLQVLMGDVMALTKSLEDETLQGLGKTLEEACGVIGKIVAEFGMAMTQAGGDDRVKFYATDFQEAMGHIVGAYFLLKQASVAKTALERDDLRPEDRTFYEQKLVTTNYFFNDILPGAVATLTNMNLKSVPGLDASFA